MTTWITYVYREIAPEQMNSIWKHIAQRQFNTVSLQNMAHLILCEYILQPFICTLCDTTIPYIYSPGTTPFFSGVEFVQHNSLCIMLCRYLEAVQDDSDEKLEQKKLYCSCMKTMMSTHDASDSYLHTLYSNKQKAHRFVKALFEKIGIKLHTTRK